MHQKYSEQELTKALLLILDRGMSVTEASIETDIPIRTIQRFKVKFINSDKQIPVSSSGMDLATLDMPMTITPRAKTELDETMLARAKFLDDIFTAKQNIIKRINLLTKTSENIDYLQKTLKTLTDIESTVAPKDDPPAAHAKTVNMFQFFNQQLKNEGYEGPNISDADIIKGD